MRVNAPNLLRQAADCIEHRRSDTGAYAAMLRDLQADLLLVRDGKRTWEEFAEFYCLAERDRPKEAA
ncbi:hypothetical protein KFK14_12750 [Sphingobium phenoxybenzoativorans]|uniref:Uncharacterized protein n=1 Tax=Sphingobium phenoxybenzoativorans TaxID=1592790 RepID=A0A975PZJ3_9SPHN|nr:hypothetical protein [Sphingobium phenoxybenzoativorans]QUT04015.1 hypothetical protein KFK14_12750 [Sphingobium phenoxybenzoativorans]